MRSTNLYGMSARKWPELDSLFFKFQGASARALDDAAAMARGICARHGGRGFALARDAKEAGQLWADRKNALYSGLALVEGARGRRVYETGDLDAGVWSASVALGLVDDCPTCAELLARVEREAEAEREGRAEQRRHAAGRERVIREILA